jgi:hypothetical protein
MTDDKALSDILVMLEFLTAQKTLHGSVLEARNRLREQVAKTERKKSK